MSLQHILKIVNFCSYVKRSIFSFKTAQLFSECCLAKNAFQKLWISVGKTQYEMAFFHKKCLIFSMHFCDVRWTLGKLKKHVRFWNEEIH